MRNYGYRCKTPGCEAFLVVGELPEKTPHNVPVPVNLGDDPRIYECPECEQQHDYYFSERVIVMPSDGNGSGN